MNNKVKFLRGTSGEYAVAEKDSDTIYFTTDDGKLYIGDKEISGSDITIDDTLSVTSTNPVQNKVVKQAIDNKADKTVATTSTDGLMSASDKGKLDGVGDTYALKSKYGDTTIDVGRKAGTAGGIRSTAEGYNTTASGDYSHAEGASTTASGNRSHAEGYLCTASSGNSHAEGNNTTASGAHSHSEGDNTIASGIGSHAGGVSSIASGDYSFAHGMYVESNNSCEVSLGKFNKSSSDTLFSIGDGTADTARHNAFEITKTGGKLHDKDIATTDLIPTTLPANGGNADTVDGLHASDFMPINGEVRKYGTIRMNGADGIRVRHIDGNDTEADGALYLNYNSPNATIYMNGTNTAIHSGNIGSQSVNYANSAGNADTLDGLHADDFVNATDKGQIQIPSNVDVPVWIHANGKRFHRYMTNAGNTGLTNVPDNSTDYVWYWYDGFNILARDNSSGKYYICDMINGNFSGWKDIYTSKYKPYVTGSFSGTSFSNDNFGFKPSFAICNDNGTIKYGNIYQMSDIFRVSFENLSDTTHQYIIFK